MGSSFVLYGGTALSLQVGGRTSVDFDFFTAEPLDHDWMAREFSFLHGATLRRRAHDTATFVIGRGNDAVAISFFGSLGFGRVSEPVCFSDNRLFAAGLLDLAAQKMKAIQQRAEAKDYLDVHQLLSKGVTLESALGAAQALYPEFNPAISLKALSYYGDISNLPVDVQRDLTTAASRVREIASISKAASSLLPDLSSIRRAPDTGDLPNRSRTIEREDPDLEL